MLSPTRRLCGCRKGAAKAKAASPVIDADGKRAEKIGRIDGINAAMWFLAIDAEAGAGGGDDGDGEDFERAMDVDEGNRRSSRRDRRSPTSAATASSATS